MWGRKSGHANALHIYLPASQTTWVFLNLDSELHDFKFWMAHELGHVLSVGLLEQGSIDVAEDFSEAFAGALLFPEEAARSCLTAYLRAKSDPAKVSVLFQVAEEYVISPFSVYRELQNHAKSVGTDFPVVEERLLHARITAFNSQFKTISQILFDDHKPSADHYMLKALEAFNTPVFTALRRYVELSDASESTISRMLDIPLVDAREMKKALI